MPHSVLEFWEHWGRRGWVYRIVVSFFGSHNDYGSVLRACRLRVGYGDAFSTDGHLLQCNYSVDILLHRGLLLLATSLGTLWQLLQHSWWDALRFKQHWKHQRCTAGLTFIGKLYGEKRSGDDWGRGAGGGISYYFYSYNDVYSYCCCYYCCSCYC